MTCKQQLKFAAMVGMMGLMLFAPLLSQQTHKPLTNLDVIKMVKGGLPESVVVSTIKSGPAKFDTSPDGLIALHKAGVTPGEMDAIMAASSNGPSSSSGNASAPEGGGPDQNSGAMPPSKSRMPRLMVTQGNSTQELKLEKTQLAETKTKPSSMKSLAGDSAVTQAMQAGVSTATYSAATHMTSGVGGSAVQEAGSVFSGVMGRRKPMVTYVWGVPSPASTNVLQTVSPSFSLDFSRAVGVNADDYEPAIVKLTPAQNSLPDRGCHGRQRRRPFQSRRRLADVFALPRRASVDTPREAGHGKVQSVPCFRVAAGRICCRAATDFEREEILRWRRGASTRRWADVRRRVDVPDRRFGGVNRCRRESHESLRISI